MIFFSIIILLFIYCCSAAPDFYLSLMLYGSQLAILPKSYLLSFFIPAFLASQVAFFRISLKLNFRHVFLYLLFLVFSNVLNIDLINLNFYDFGISLLKNLLLFIFFSFTISASLSFLKKSSRKYFFLPFMFLLAFSSLSSFLAILVYQSSAYTPLVQVERFTSSLDSEAFLNPFFIHPFGLVESLPFKSLFSRSTWFVLEPIHFSFYLFCLTAISLLVNSPYYIILSFIFLSIGLLASKSITSLFSIFFIVSIYFNFKYFSAKISLLLSVLLFYLPQLFYFAFSSFLIYVFNLIGKSTNYQQKIFEYSSFYSFWPDFLFGNQSPTPISHNLSINLLVHLGFPISFVVSVSICFFIFLIYRPLLTSDFAYISLAIMITMVFIQLPSTLHPLFAFIFATLSSLSFLNSYHHD